ncbi:anti-sigma factor [Rhizobium sp. SL86]|uniref:anti-sigma factor n=1 Tax=Rhizobium sp. SL86 TaxID=2995148 RepID=UPI002274C6C1|nr:anti-sigma factor [Rhizobium sp. SL86]MCY1664793.1 anti-sigma factor [Rhizobium sp. SL86]
MIFDDLEAIADEYVLGLLDPAEQAAVEAEANRNPALQQAIGRAQDRFLPLDMTAAPVPVPPDLWPRIEARLSPAKVNRAEEPPPAANDNRLRFWRRSAFGGLAASLLLAIGLGWSLMRSVEPLVVAVLVNEAGEVQAVVEDFGSERAVVRLLTDVGLPADRTLQVWTLPSKDMGPVSLGLIDGASSTRLDPPSLPRPRDAQLYEITLEPAGGSPTGRPTGPILAKGFAKLPR